MSKNNAKNKILIIGAGLAGLAACNRLLEYGFDVTILEAQSRCGGRIHIDHHSFGIPFGLGANWIHGAENNPMTFLANQYHAQMVGVNFEKFNFYNRNNSLITIDEVKQFEIKFELLLNEAKEISSRSLEDMPLASVLQAAVGNKQFSANEMDLYQGKLNYFENYLGANYKNLSAKHWDAEEAWPGENCFVINTYESIVKGLLSNCSVHLNTIVKAITLNNNVVTVETDNKIYHADAVIVTVPLGVLKKNSIAFFPPLPASKVEAIKRLGMGLFNVTALKFPSTFWPEQAHAMLFTQFDNPAISSFFNLHHFMKEPILVGYSGGDSAKDIEQLSDDELIQQVMTNFRKMFGSVIPEPISYINTRWSEDPFAFGSYSYLQVGSSKSELDALAEPIAKRIFFAGEATSSTYFATTHGAYLTGIREAERIKNIFYDEDK